MGAEQSTINDNPTEAASKHMQDTPSELPIEDVFGFQVLKVKPSSPAYECNLIPFFDFIVAIEGEDTIETIKQFSMCINKHKDGEVKLHVYSIKTNKLRQMLLKPRLDWSAKKNEGLLGCSIRFCSILKGIESVWRILEVSENSPAQKAGLNPFIDYVIGCEYRNLINEPDFYNLVKNYEDRVLTLLVYNSEWDTCRDVIIIPKADWGGEGLLGCGVGYGYLHRVPVLKAENEDVEQIEAQSLQKSPFTNEDFPIIKVEEIKDDEEAHNATFDKAVDNKAHSNTDIETTTERVSTVDLNDIETKGIGKVGTESTAEGSLQNSNGTVKTISKSKIKEPSHSTNNDINEKGETIQPEEASKHLATENKENTLIVDNEEREPHSISANAEHSTLHETEKVNSKDDVKADLEKPEPTSLFQKETDTTATASSLDGKANEKDNEDETLQGENNCNNDKPQSETLEEKGNEKINEGKGK